MRLILSLIGFFLIVICQLFAADGDLDVAFGSGGKVTTDFSISSEDIYVVAIQTDGKIVVGGAYYPSGSSVAGLARYNPDGSLDAGFGSGGLVLTGFQGVIFDLAILQDGTIVVTGEVYELSTSNLILGKFNPDGTQQFFIVAYDSGPGIFDTGFGIAFQSDGRIIIGGYTTSAGSEDFAVWRFTGNGVLDTTFGTNGIAITDFDGQNDRIASIVVQSDGKIVAAGDATMTASGQDFAIVRYNPDGTLDATFGSSGKTTTDFNNMDLGFGTALQDDGKIVVVGATQGATCDLAMVRFNTDGSLDTTFGSGGRVTSDFGLHEFGQEVAIQENGRIVVAGGGNATLCDPDDITTDFAVARYTPDGILDPTFGTAGAVFTDFSMGTDFASTIALQPDGKIIAAGNATTTTIDAGLVRYLAALFDDFLDEDAGNWTTRKGNWTVSNGRLSGTTDRKADALAPFPACSICCTEATLRIDTSGGRVSLLGWYQDKKNLVEVRLMEDRDKILLLQKANGIKVAKAKVLQPVDSGVDYVIRTCYDGFVFDVYLNAGLILSIPPGAPPDGLSGFRVKSTTKTPVTGSFDNIVRSP